MEVTEVFKGCDRIEMLGYDIISLISNGKKETVDNIIEHLENKDIVHYLINTYEEDLCLIKENGIYDLNDWEEIFYQFSYITFNSDVSRKMGIVNEETDGLLVLLNIILQIVSERTYNVK